VAAKQRTTTEISRSLLLSSVQQQGKHPHPHHTFANHLAGDEDTRRLCFDATTHPATTHRHQQANDHPQPLRYHDRPTNEHYHLQMNATAHKQTQTTPGPTNGCWQRQADVLKPPFHSFHHTTNISAMNSSATWPTATWHPNDERRTSVRHLLSLFIVQQHGKHPHPHHTFPSDLADEEDTR
jgi:hypothetical protein